MLPAVILVSWTHGRPGKDKSTRLEKVGVPINIIATLGLLITVFSSKDMGARANLVTVANELGQQEQHNIPRDSFRRRTAVFFWENLSGDPELDWLQYGITDLLVLDLAQEVLDAASRRDSSEPSLWFARSLLQQARGNTQMALASVNYALAIWSEADPEFVDYQAAVALRDDLMAIPAEN